MRLIILNQFFYPDYSATSQLMTDLAESLVERGIDVTALAGRGRYNGGGDALAAREDYRGIHVERAWATNFGKNSVAGRLCDYFSFYLGAAWKLLTLSRHDVVMALTTPPLISLLALLACRLRGMKLVTLVQDIYPDVGVALGAFKAGSLAARMFDALNRFVLGRADRIVVLSDCMRERVAVKVGRDAERRIDVIHNWADGAKIQPLEDGERNAFAQTHNPGHRFVVLFSGNFGRVNDFATALDAARILKYRSDIIFIFIGDGARASEIREFMRKHELVNVRLLPYQPREQLRYSLAAGHVHLVTLVEGLAGLSVPSKTYGILAAGRPVLFVGDTQSDIARLVSEHHCGEVVATGEGKRLAEIIAACAEDGEHVKRMGRKARALFEQRFERAHAVSAYIESLNKCMNREPVRAKMDNPRVEAVK